MASPLATPLFHPQTGKTGQRPEDITRLLLAQQLLKSGTDTSPIESPWQGVARLGQALAGGYLNYKVGQDQKTREGENAATMAQALRATTPTWTNPPGGTEQAPPGAPPLAGTPITPGQSVPVPGATGGFDAALRVLSGNPNTAGMAAQLGFSQIQDQQKARQAEALKLLDKGMLRNPDGSVGMVPKYGEVSGQIAADQTRAGIPAKVEEIRAMAIPEAEKARLIEEATNPYKLQRAQASAPRISIENKGPMEGTGTLFKNAAEAFTTSQTAAMAADKREPLYQALEKASEGFKFGATAEARATGLRLLTDVGLSDGKAAGWADLATQAGRQLELANTPKGQGQITENERGLIREASVRMSQTPDGFKLGLELTRKADKYDRDVARIYRDNAAKNGGAYVNPVEVANEIAKLGPVFTAAEENKLRGYSGGAAPAAGGGGKADPLGIR